MRILIAAALAASVLAGCSQAESENAEAAPAYTARQYNAAVNDIARTEADRESDANRKPGDLLAFAQIDPGETVGDYIMGGGYVTRLLAMAVGANGRVFAFQPTEFIDFRPEYAAEQDATITPYGDTEGNPVRVLPLRASIAEPGFPAGELDTIITVMNFHDLYLEPMPEGTAEKALAALFTALKPGGKLVVVDHRAADGSGTEAANTLHRIDEQAAIEAITAAGFRLEEESDLYARPDDPRDANVFDEAIRGRTDQFALRFVKPA
jgi:predicted methyltransferase